MPARKSISFRVDEDLKHEIELHAAAAGIDRSVAIEELVRRGLEIADQDQPNVDELGQELSQVRTAVGCLTEQIQSLRTDLDNTPPLDVASETDAGIRMLKMLEELREVARSLREEVGAANSESEPATAELLEGLRTEVQHVRREISSTEHHHDNMRKQLQKIGENLTANNRGDANSLEAALQPSEPLGQVIHLLSTIRDDLATSVNCLLIYAGRVSPYTARKWVESVFELDYPIAEDGEPEKKTARVSSTQ